MTRTLGFAEQPASDVNALVVTELVEHQGGMSRLAEGTARATFSNEVDLARATILYAAAALK